MRTVEALPAEKGGTIVIIADGFAVFPPKHYDSLEVKAETKTTKYGLYALVGHTYSRATDTV